MFVMLAYLTASSNRASVASPLSMARERFFHSTPPPSMSVPFINAQAAACSASCQAMRTHTHQGFH